jgi:hypothetical protein
MIQDRHVIARLVFCVLIGAVGGMGCGDGSGKARTDSGIAIGADGGATPDLAGDGASMDALVDAAQPRDVRDEGDGATTPDTSRDVATGDAAADLFRRQDADVDSIAHPAEDASSLDGADARQSADGLLSDGGVMSQATITFVVTNTGSTPLYLTTQCWVDFQVVSVDDGSVYPNQSSCTCLCSDTSCQGPIKCAPCAPRSGIEIAPGGSRQLVWTAQTNTVTKKIGLAGEFECMAHHPIPAGPYQISIPIFNSANDAASRSNTTTIRASFALGTSDARIEVPLK